MSTELQPFTRDRPILVVESDADAAAGIVDQLVADGYDVALARTARHARTLARLRGPSLAILAGVDSPRGGLALLAEFRAGMVVRAPGLPIIVIGPRSGELDMLRAFEAGADDFLSSPPSYLELRARLAALLRRSYGHSRLSVLRIGALSIDTEARTVCVGGRLVALRRLEYELLVHLAQAPRRVCPGEELLRLVWGDRAQSATRTLDVHASRLRRKLMDAGNGPCVINVRGVGYRLI